MSKQLVQPEIVASQDRQIMTKHFRLEDEVHKLYFVRFSLSNKFVQNN